MFGGETARGEAVVMLEFFPLVVSMMAPAPDPGAGLDRSDHEYSQEWQLSECGPESGR